MKRNVNIGWSAVRAALAIFVFIVSASLPTRAQVNAEQVMNIGRNVLSMEDYMLAIQYFNQAIKAKPYLSEPYYFRALAKLSLDDYKGAEDDCTQAIERNKFKTEAYKARGFALQQQGKDSLAVVDYDKGLEYNPLDKYFLFYKAVAQTRMKCYVQADSTFAMLLRQYPGFGEGVAERGRMNLLRGDTVAALEDLDKAITVNRGMVNAFLLRADINARRRDWHAAAADMQEAIRLEPQEPDLYVNRAFLRYNLDDYFGAMSDYNYALQLQPENVSALFNRGLLRYEVKDLGRAESDFTEVLSLDPGNFHALYNRGLVRLELGQASAAASDFRKIIERYPRFYPVYYAMAEARRKQGDMRGAVMTARHGEELVRQYVKDPEKNPLQRPAIAAATSNSGLAGERGDENETDVMDRFNQLRTVSASASQQMSFNEKIKGRVQDRNINITPEPSYVLTFQADDKSLRSLSNYFRELDDLNQNRYIDRQIYLTSGLPAVSDDAAVRRLFDIASDFDRIISKGTPRPVDYLGRGVARTQLKDFAGAMEDFDAALAASPDFTPALMGRAYARMARIESQRRLSGFDTADSMPDAGMNNAAAASAEDYDRALSVNPRLVYAWFNKGNIYYASSDFTPAVECYSRAISADPEFGAAYYNRGLCYLQMGNRQQAFADLSKAGELGVLPSYNLLKRMR